MPMNKKKLATSYLNISIPQDVENMQLPNPELLTFYKNYEDTYNTTYMMNAWQTTGIGIY